MPVAGDVLAFKDVLAFFFQQADVVRWYWNFYSTVAVALLGLLAGMKVDAIALKSRWVLVVGFLLFALGNLVAIDGIQQERQALKAAAQSQARSPEEKDVAAALSVRGRWQYMTFHLVLDAAVIGAVCWFVAERKKASGSKG